MPLNMNIRTDTRQTIDFLRDLAGRVKNVATPLRAFGRVMLRSIADNFEQGGRPDKWQGLADATKRSRRGTRALALSNTGILKNSVQFLVQGNTLRIGPTGPASIYARIHQLGGQAGPGLSVTIPARPYLLFQNEDLVEGEELIRRYILRRESRLL